MNSLEQGQRVRVHAAGVHNRVTIPGGALGTVVRPLIASRAAWVELDERSVVRDVHAFDDRARSRYVCAYPEDCEVQISTEREVG